MRWLLAIALTIVSVGATPRHPDELALEPIDFTSPQAVEAQLSSGIPVYIFENHDLPLVSIDIRFRMGRRYLDPEEFAAIGLLGRLWDTGGAGNLSPEALEERLAALDVTISAWVSNRAGSVSAFMVREDLREAISLWRDVLLEPRLDKERLKRSQAQALKDVQRINNNPDAIADQRFYRLLYGEEFPGVQLDTRASIEDVARDDLIRLHRRFVHPDNAIIGVSGDVGQHEILTLLDEVLAGWGEDVRFEPPSQAEWTPHPRPGVYVLTGDYEQSQVRIGRLIPHLTRTSPDYPISRILDFALGWGRVFYRSRAEGISYGAAVRVEAGEERATLNGFGSTGAGTTVDLLRLLIEEVDRMESEPFSVEEIETSRSFMIGTEISRSETARGIIGRKLEAITLGRPDDYIEVQLDGLKAADAAMASSFVDRYVHSDEPLVVFALGDPEKFGASLEDLGQGDVVELEPIIFGE